MSTSLTTTHKTCLKRWNGSGFDIVYLAGSADITVLGEPIEIIGGNFGTLKAGQVISSQTPVATVLRMMMTQYTVPEYIVPEATFTVSPGTGDSGVSAEGLYEVGTQLNASFASVYVQQDGGDVIENMVYCNGSKVGANSSNSYTKNVTEALDDATYEYSASIQYDTGAAKADSGGNYDATGLAGGVVNSTATAVYTGRRAVFAGGDDGTLSLDTSAGIRKLTSFLTLEAGKTGTVQFGAVKGSTVVTLAYPASYGTLNTIVYSEQGANVMPQFDVTTMSVKGANSFDAVSYNVYTLTFAQPTVAAMTFVANFN